MPPIFRCTVYVHHGAASTGAIRYPRLSNLPNNVELHQTLADLEGTQDGLVTSSGMAAIATAVLTVLRDCGHVLVQQGIYGGTHQFITAELTSLGITHTFIDSHAPGSWEAALQPNTRAIYVEAITNPTMRVADHRAVVEFARAHQLRSLIDSTFATPVNFRPAELGFDLVLHSVTKNLNGHSDLVAGAILGRSELIDQLRPRLNLHGGTLDPHACFLASRGLKTLGLRVRQQNESAQAIARWLQAHPAVKQVGYPGLSEHPDHQRARELFSGFGGMLCFELAGGAAAATRLTERTRLFVHSASLGGVESLLTIPAATSHLGLTPAKRARAGVADGLVRMSVGIESTEDLLADLAAALG